MRGISGSHSPSIVACVPYLIARFIVTLYYYKRSLAFPPLRPLGMTNWLILATMTLVVIVGLGMTPSAVLTTGS